MADRNSQTTTDYPQPAYTISDQLSQAARSAALWNNSNPPLPRGRAPKDPNARAAKYNCNSIQEMEAALRTYLTAPPSTPEHSTCELTLWSTATLDTPANTNDENGAPHLNDVLYQPRTVLEALQPTVDPKDNMKKQRAVSKTLVAAIQRVDGYRYSFHNNWKSGEENAFRFSYYCNDSLLNKDRVANGKAGSQGRRATKPVYDCKGVLSIKFSATRQCIDVIYKHIPCHPTYEERAPPPRRESKRRASWERDNSKRVRKSVTGIVTSPSEQQPGKRTKKLEAAPRASLESELRQSTMTSLLDLMRANEEEASRVQEAATRSNGVESRPVVREPSVAVIPKPAEVTVPNSICEICLHRRARCDGARPKCNACKTKDWPCWYQKPAEPPRNPNGTKAAPEPTNPATVQLTKEKKQLQKERDQAQQSLKSSRDEIETLKDQVKNQAKDFEDRIKRLENQLQEKSNPLPPPQITQQPTHNHTHTTLSQTQTTSAYQPPSHQHQHSHQHQLSQQPPRLSSTSYSTHGAERPMSHTSQQPYSSQIAAAAVAASSKPHSFSQQPPQQQQPMSMPDHTGRAPIYHGQSQQLVPPRWTQSHPQFMSYQQQSDSSNLWNATHMPSQLR